jgi:DNA-binding NarL/FixJ family response regulator
MKDVEIRKEIPDGPAVLTEREVEILQYISNGLTLKEVAQETGLSIRTIDSHRQNVLKKTGAKKVIQVIFALYKKGIIK